MLRQIGLCSSLILACCLCACSGLLTFTQTTKYDNQIVRGKVTYLATRRDMEENWAKSVAHLPDAPTESDFLQNYQKVTVTIERRLGSGVFVYPYVPPGLQVGIGDIVDVPLYVGGPLVGLFAGRPQILRVVCKANDEPCLISPQGSVRGSVGIAVER